MHAYDGMPSDRRRRALGTAGAAGACERAADRVPAAAVAEGRAMKAVLFEKHGGPEVLHLAEVPDPTAGPGEVVVDIHAASVNAADYKVRLGGPGHNLKFPHILGRDFSGIVSALGAGVNDFAVGDAVFGVTDQGIEGAYAEKLPIKA